MKVDRLEANSTVLSILRGTTDEDAVTREKSLRRFCEQYTAPLVAYLQVSRRIPMEDAEDLVHDFWTQKLLVPPASQNIVAKYFESITAGPSRGFRKFIFRSLANYQLDHARKTQRRGPILSLEQLEGWQPAEDGQVDAEFDLIWARHILGQVVEQVRSECENKGQQNMWSLFAACISRQAANVSQPALSELALIHKFDTTKQASAALITISRKFDRALRQRVANYLPWQETTEDSEALLAEVAELRKILSRPGSVDIEMLGLLEKPPELSQIDPSASDCSLTSMSFGHNWMSHLDLTAMWQGMLEQRLAEWLPEFSEPVPEDWKSLRFGDLATWSNPHLDLLTAVHQYAKRQGTSIRQASLESALLPIEFFSIIYLTAIAVAYLQLSVQLSKAPRRQLIERVRSTTRLPWLDSRTLELLADLREKL